MAFVVLEEESADLFDEIGLNQSHYISDEHYPKLNEENYRLLKTEKIYFDFLPKKPLIVLTDLERKRKAHVKLVPLLTTHYEGIQDEKAISRSNSSSEHSQHSKRQQHPDQDQPQHPQLHSHSHPHLHSHTHTQNLLQKSRSRRNAVRGNATEGYNLRLRHLKKRNTDRAGRSVGSVSGASVHKNTQYSSKYPGIKLVTN